MLCPSCSQDSGMGSYWDVRECDHGYEYEALIMYCPDCGYEEVVHL